MTRQGQTGVLAGTQSHGPLGQPSYRKLSNPETDVIRGAPIGEPSHDGSRLLGARKTPSPLPQARPPRSLDPGGRRCPREPARGGLSSERHKRQMQRRTDMLVLDRTPRANLVRVRLVQPLNWAGGVRPNHCEDAKEIAGLVNSILKGNSARDCRGLLGPLLKNAEREIGAMNHSTGVVGTNPDGEWRSCVSDGSVGTDPSETPLGGRALLGLAVARMVVT